MGESAPTCTKNYLQCQGPHAGWLVAMPDRRDKDWRDCAMRLCAGDVFAQAFYFSREHGQKSHHGFQQRAFAHSVLAEQDEDFAGPNIQFHIAHHHGFAVTAAYAGESQRMRSRVRAVHGAAARINRPQLRLTDFSPAKDHSC